MKVKLWLFLGSFGLLLFVILFWLYNHSYIEIALGSGSSFSYTLLDQSSGTEVSQKVSGQTVKKLVKRGSYEILAENANQTFFEVTKTRPFLGTTRITAKLQPENQRSFVGDNPSPCMFFAEQVLLSSGCGDTFDNLVLHAPATPSQPTYTKRNDGALYGTIEGIAKTRLGNLILLKAPEIDEDQGEPHMLYTLDSLTGNVSNGVGLQGLRDDATYRLENYRDGFVLISDDKGEVFYFTDPGTKPKQLSITNSVDSKLKRVGTNTEGGVLTSLFTDSPSANDDPKSSTSKGSSEVIVDEDGKSRSFRLKGRFNSVTLCQKDTLCLINADGLSVYDISNKLRLLFSVNKVKWVKSASKQLLVGTTRGVVLIDPKTKSGSLSYSFGNYTYCGVAADDLGYVLCLVNPNKDKVALRITSGSKDDSQIDKKIAELSKLSEIRKLSIYGRYIFVSPDVGDVVFDETSRTFTYDSNTKKSVNALIQQAIDKQRIDRTSYTIINTLQ